MVSVRNIGIVEVSQGLIYDDTALMVEVFARLKLLPVRCEVLFSHNTIRYEAISENFPEKNTAEQLKEYQIETTLNEAGELESVKLVPVEGGE